MANDSAMLRVCIETQFDDIVSFSFRWNSCKQNKQGANNCTTIQNQTPSPEGEKLHSDSGISVDSQSLQEQQVQTQTGNICT